ncbi:MAG: hypothetical protein ACE5HE_14375, partial [Phycisphaerae bacterium]
GARRDDDRGYNSGSAYVFTLTPGGWAQPWKLTAVDAASRAFFGHSVSINSETAVIGADRDDVSCGEGGGADCGAVYVFRREKAVWHPDGKLSAADTYPAQMFGSSVASTAGRIVVGTPLDGHAGASSGAAYFFLHDGAEWVQRGKLTATDAASGDGFGTGVSMDGPNVLIGAPNDHVGGSAGRSGSAYLFRLLNLFDFAEFQACMTGALEAAPGPLGAACAAFDCDGDDDIDLADHASFWAVFAGL